MQARPERSAWRLHRSSRPAAANSSTDGSIKSSFLKYDSSLICPKSGRKIGLTVRRISRSGAWPPTVQKPAQAGFCGLLPLAATLPMSARCQGPTSSQTGRLAVGAQAATGLDCGRPAEYVPRKGSTTVKAVSDRDGESLYRAVRFIFLVRVCGEIARSMLPPIFCAMS